MQIIPQNSRFVGKYVIIFILKFTQKIMTCIDFSQLSPEHAPHFWQSLYADPQLSTLAQELLFCDYQALRAAWMTLSDDEMVQTTWLIALFNGLYGAHTHLVRGESEPEYFASKEGQPARIEFAHGFFQSALHEISHWCVAGAKRRALDDFGYWYCPDGRDEHTQREFEQVEIKPQAIECLLSLALGRYFYVSADNLNADFDTSSSTFAHDVYAQAHAYLQNPHTLPKDAKRLIWIFLDIYFQKGNL